MNELGFSESDAPSETIMPAGNRRPPTDGPTGQTGGREEEGRRERIAYGRSIDRPGESAEERSAMYYDTIDLLLLKLLARRGGERGAALRLCSKLQAYV